MLLQLFIINSLVSSLYTYMVYGENETNDLIAQGRLQYQLLRERGNLPKYGVCWKSTMEIVDEGCRELSEETQSDIALALTNCFLEMSGLETHHCQMDKKENLRRICISSMPDRAFNVYTEFYTHTLNMCWFLRGQIWQETISENTLKVGKQLETSAAKQEILLEIQKESLEIQNKVLQHGKDIESILSDLNRAAQNHKEILLMLGQAINNLQSWLIGEVSWINTMIFYFTFGVFFIILTSTPRTIISRLPILILLVVNVCIERVICAIILSKSDFRTNANELYGDIHEYVRFLRYCFVIISFCILLYRAYFHEDALMKNYNILDNIFKQNLVILESLQTHKSLVPERAYLVYKSDVKSSLESKTDEFDDRSNDDNHKKSFNGYQKCNPSIRLSTTNLKYNLRSRQNTPTKFD